jgi:hypothetical protein
MFYKSLTPADSFPFPQLKLFPALPDFTMTHRLTDTSTQQFNDSHFLSCTFTLMRFQKPFFILIHRICTSSTAQAILAISSSQPRKKRVRSFPHVLSSLSLIPLVYFCNRSSTLPQTHRKILSTAKLFSPQLLTPLLTTVFFQSPKNCPLSPTRPSDPSLPPSLASSKSFSHSPVPNRHSP